MDNTDAEDDEAVANLSQSNFKVYLITGWKKFRVSDFLKIGCISKP